MNQRTISAIILCISAAFTLKIQAERPYLIPVYTALLTKNPIQLVRNLVHAYEVTSFTQAIGYMVETYKKAYVIFGPEYFNDLVRSGNIDLLLDPQIFQKMLQLYEEEGSFFFSQAVSGDLEQWLNSWFSIPSIVRPKRILTQQQKKRYGLPYNF